MQPRPHVRSLLDERSEANKAKFGGAATTGGFNTGPRASLGFEAAKKRGVKQGSPAGSLQGSYAGGGFKIWHRSLSGGEAPLPVLNSCNGKIY